MPLSTKSLFKILPYPDGLNREHVTAIRNDCSTQITTKEWEDQRPNIERYYLEDGEKLKIVMRRMEELHGFKASKRQYKYRIEQWDLKKNVPSGTMRALVQKSNNRKILEGKQSDIRRGKQKIPLRKLNDFVRKQKLNDGDIASSPSHTPSTPAGFNISTPAEIASPADDPALDYTPTALAIREINSPLAAIERNGDTLSSPVETWLEDVILPDIETSTTPLDAYSQPAACTDEMNSLILAPAFDLGDRRLTEFESGREGLIINASNNHANTFLMVSSLRPQDQSTMAVSFDKELEQAYVLNNMWASTNLSLAGDNAQGHEFRRARADKNHNSNPFLLPTSVMLGYESQLLEQSQEAMYIQECHNSVARKRKANLTWDELSTNLETHTIGSLPANTKRRISQSDPFWEIVAKLDSQALLRSPLLLDELNDGTHYFDPSTEQSLTLLVNSFPVGDETIVNYATWKISEFWIPQVEAVMRYGHHGKLRLQRAEVCYRVGYYYLERGQYKAAKSYGTESLLIRDEVLGRCNLETIQSATLLGDILQKRNRYIDSEVKYREVLDLLYEMKYWEGLDLFFSTCSSIHPEILKILRRLARSLLGRHPKPSGPRNGYNEAEKLARLALTGCETLLGTNHPDTAKTAHVLALILKRQGKFKEAEKMYQKSLALKQSILGRCHPETFNTSFRLARLLEGKGRFDEARQKFRETRIGFETSLGLDHPYTLKAFLAEATSLVNREKYDEAIQMYREELNNREISLGKEHFRTLAALNDLASLLYRQGKQDEACELSREAFKRSEKAFGGVNKKFLRVAVRLGLLLQEQNQLEEAGHLFQRALDCHKSLHGILHESTLRVMSYRAAILRQQGRSKEAEVIFQHVLNNDREIFGKNHTHLVRVARHVAAAMQEQGTYQQSERLCYEVLDREKATFGKSLKETIFDVSQFAISLNSQRQTEAAERLHRRVLAAKEDTIGKDDPSTLRTAHRLAGILEEQGNYDEATRYYQRWLAGAGLRFSMNNRTIGGATLRSFVVLCKQSRFKEADLIFQRTMNTKAHPDVVKAIVNLTTIFYSQCNVCRAQRLFLQALYD